MKFRQYFLINEADPPGLGGPPPGGPPGLGGPPPGGPPGLGGPPPGGPPGLGGPPMGGPPGLGGPPMGGPPGLGGPPPSEPPVIPKHADVWDVLDFILNNKPLEHEKKIQAQNQNNQSQQSDPAANQQQMPAGPALMS